MGTTPPARRQGDESTGWDSQRTEVFDLPRGSEASAAARSAVDRVARSVGRLEPDIRLLVSELVTASVERLPEAGPLRLGISISQRVVRVELQDRGPSSHDAWAEVSGPGQAGRMLMDALTTRWGNAQVDGVLWFEIERPESMSGSRPSSSN
jgi:anti-sigma regulatory factor (Ser/Thr protein kinase)